MGRSALPPELQDRRRRRVAGQREGLAALPALSAVAAVDAMAYRDWHRSARTCIDEHGMPARGQAVWAVTGGQWSLLDLVRACLVHTGPARLRLSSWTVGLRDAQTLARMLATGEVAGLQVFLDSSFPVREPEYTVAVVAAWGLCRCVVTNTHAKIATIRAPGWDIAIESSMNLNGNPRFENAVIAHIAAVADMYDGVFDALAKTGHTLATPRQEVNDTFHALTGQGGEYASGGGPALGPDPIDAPEDWSGLDADSDGADEIDWSGL